MQYQFQSFGDLSRNEDLPPRLTNQPQIMTQKYLIPLTVLTIAVVPLLLGSSPQTKAKPQSQTQIQRVPGGKDEKRQ